MKYYTKRTGGKGFSKLMRRAPSQSSQAVWNEMHPKESDSHLMVDGAIRRGELVRLPCEVCGNPKSESHHIDAGPHYAAANPMARIAMVAVAELIGDRECSLNIDQLNGRR